MKKVYQPSFDELTAYRTLLSAWRVVSSKASAGGVDGMSIADFEKDLGTHLGSIRKSLKDKKWVPRPYLSITIPKKNGERRKLGLLSIKDKIVQQALKQIIERRVEKTLPRAVFAYRAGYGHTKAIRRAKAICMDKAVTHIVKFDIDNYFDTVNHAILFKRLPSVINDNELLRLIELCIKMGMVDNKMVWQDVEAGLPQGAVLSPLLANFYLVPLDHLVLSKTDRYVRYADDFIIGCSSETEAIELSKRISSFLSKRLKLALNQPLISSVCTGFDFLGLNIDNKRVDVSDEKLNDLFERLKSLKWSANGFDKSGIQKIQGIQRYYVPLLDDSILIKLDTCLITHLKKIITDSVKEIKNRKVLQEAMMEIPFSYEKNILNAKIIRDSISEYYLTYKKEKEIHDADNHNKKIIAARKREYRTLEVEASELVVGTPGVFIGVSETGITLKLFGKPQKISHTGNLRHISITNDGISISSNALKYCMDKGIGIDCFDAKGHHTGGFYKASQLQASCWHKQCEMPLSKRFELAKLIIIGKLKNQLNLIKYFHKYHKGKYPNLGPAYDNTNSVLESLLQRLKILKLEDKEDYRSKIMGYEAQGAQAYWSYIRTLLEDDNVAFEARTRQGATDLVNCMLNYGYAILYSNVWRTVLSRQLNPYESVLHAKQAGKPTFVFDLIEIFRCQSVDRVVISLVQKKERLEISNGVLDDDTRKNLAAHVMERLNKYEKFRNKEMRLIDIIRSQISDIKAFIVDNEKYKPYIAKW